MTDDTQADTLSDSKGGQRDLDGVSLPDDRYQLGRTIGSGGMGEIRIAKDIRIDREVAVKLLRSAASDPDAVARFVREAKVQGQLDHPAIVPVYDLGNDRDGAPYFVMKRLAGTTLADVLTAIAARDRDMRERWPRRLLLARLIDVCLAVELAHTRGVVHRDLKPSNIMLGDFGEVYVLDWGLARITGESPSYRPTRARSAPGIDQPGRTIEGDLLGTPGYMPPEQARGEVIDHRADVFALGCILYEIVSGAPALPRGIEALAATLSARCHRPSEKWPVVDIPPELDDLCALATADDREQRPTARGLGDAIQSYLDGDRDLERRRVLAVEHVTSARSALTVERPRRESSAPRSPSETARATAMREVGRAIALDAGNRDAQDLLALLLFEAPDVIPAAALLAADEVRITTRQAVLRTGAFQMLGVVALIAILFAFPVRHVWPIVAIMAGTTVSAALCWFASRRRFRIDSPMYLLVLLLVCVLLFSATIILGPFLIVPIFAVGSVAVFISQPTGYRPSLVLVLHMVAIMSPLALEWLGVLPSTYRIEGHALILQPWVIDLTPLPTIVLVTLATVTQLVITCVMTSKQRLESDRAEDRLHAQQWHLAQLIPPRTST